MWTKSLILLALAGAGLCQLGLNEQVRTVKFRRPKTRPRIIDIENPDGDLKGRPVELTNLRLAAALSEEDQDNSLFSESQTSFAREPLVVNVQRPQANSNAALEALIATAQREEPRLAEEQQQLLQQPQQQQQARPAGRRRVPGIPPRRRRPNRPEQQVAGEGEERRRPSGGQREEPVKTLERYSHKNPDGSFTFGYVGADGSFREETRGVDCITRGKYGYIDPDGVKREYTYTSGLPCDEGEEPEEGDLQNLGDGPNVEDPVDPRERFRQTSEVQLTADQIPNAARPRVRQQQARPPQQAFPQRATPNRARVPATGGQGNALKNLLDIADDQPVAAAPTAAAAPAAPVRIRPAPRRPVSRPAAARPAVPRPAQSGSFDFDSELEGFTLNRPAITFEQQNTAAGAPAAVGPQFQSQLVFNQQTGTFSTALKQNIPGHGQLSLQNAAAPSGATTAQPSSPTTPAPATTASRQPTTSFFAATTPRSRPALPTPVPANPSASPRPSIVPAGTIKLDFEPLNVPDPSTIQLKPAPTPAARPSPTIRTSPALPPATPAVTRPQAAVVQSRPTVQATTAVRPTTAVRTQPTAAVRPAAPSSSASSPSSNNGFFVFQPFNQQGRPVVSNPVSQSFPTRTNQAAFQVIPQSSRPAQPSRPAPSSSLPASATRPASPQIQFGFQPVRQQQAAPRPGVGQSQQARPFTAFSSPLAPRPVQAQQARPQQARPQQARPQQLGVPPQLQQQQRPAGTFTQFDSRFAPRNPGQVSQLRPNQFQTIPQQSQQPFTAFG